MIHILDENEITSNYKLLREIISNTFKGDRLIALNNMYDVLEERILLTPASSTDFFHNAFAGGYIDHVLRVTRNAVNVMKLYEDSEMEIGDFDTETLIFTALHHDLGKIGNETENWYIPNDSQWHVENQGKIYTTNPSMHYMNLNDRTFWMLNHFGIKISEVEYLGIKLTDGLYDESNKQYFISYNKNNYLKTSLPFIMHQADIMAARYENDRWRRGSGVALPKSTGGRPSKKEKLSSIKMESKLDFDSIFKTD